MIGGMSGVTGASEVICLACALPYREGRPGDGEAVCRCPPPQAEQIECPSCGGSLRVGARACPYCRCTLATARCDHCAAWNLASSKFCRLCGKRVGTSQASARKAFGPCPRCGEALAARHYADLDVDECDGCGGLFLEEPMLERLVRSRDQAAPLHLALPKRERRPETKVQYLKCPVCDTLMNRQIFGRISGVIVDTCKPHGVWFDAGELSAIIAFIERGGLAQARERERAQQEREKAERQRLAQQSWEPSGPVSRSSESMFISIVKALLS